MDRRVVVTGMGAVTPLGCTVDTFWEGLKNGKCGIDLIQKFDTTDFKVKVGAEVKDFDPELYMSKKDVTHMLCMHWLQLFRHLMIAD